MRKYSIFRLLCVVLLWIFLCFLLIRGRGINGQVIFTIIASGIIIFIPIYKKINREKDKK